MWHHVAAVSLSLCQKFSALRIMRRASMCLIYCKIMCPERDLFMKVSCFAVSDIFLWSGFTSGLNE